jgi:aminomethyltransferase
MSKTTPLYETHKKLKGNIVDFHGVLLPVFYSSITDEHNAVRTSVGVFDVSHMGNFVVKYADKQTGIDSLNALLPNDYSKIFPGKMIYSPMCYENGTCVDDLIVSCMSDTEYHIVVNSANIDKDFAWMQKNLKNTTEFKNISDEMAIIAVQGRNAVKLLADKFGFDVTGMKSFTIIQTKYDGADMLISRSGYTGEDGFELIVENAKAVKLFDEILEKGKEYGILPCGLGARDTLRTEAGLPLYGQELDDKHSPLQAMIKWSIKLNKSSDFIGKQAMIDGQNGVFSDVMIGFEVVGRAIARTDMEIMNEQGETIGKVTSGTFSPTLKKNIGIAFVKSEYKDAKTLAIKIRNKTEQINVLPIPFYKKDY